MPYTVPNQRTVHIHREAAKSDFLGIKNENWMAASRDLGAHALRLYLYLAANADGYKLALSPAAVLSAIGMPRSTYSDQFKILIAKGYLVANSRNGYDFFEVPKTRAEIEEIAQKSRTACGCAFEMDTADEHSMTARGQNGTHGMIEINNSHLPTNNRINTAGFGVPEEHQSTAFIPPKNGGFVF